MVDIQTFFGDQYVKELRGRGEDHDPTLLPFASGWVDLQEKSGLTAPVYLKEFANDLSNVLHYYGVNYGRIRRDGEFEGYTRKFAADQPDSVTAQMLATYNTTRRRNLFEKRQDEELGLPLVLYLGDLGTTLYSLTRGKGPEAALERLDRTGLDDELKLLLHQELDTAIFSSMIHDRSPESGADKARFASSEIARRAMRSAYDMKLIKRVNSTKDKEKQFAIENLIQLASTDGARDRMLGYLAIKDEGVTQKSRYRAKYQTPVNDTYLRTIWQERTERERKAREAEEAVWRENEQRERREHEEFMRAHQERMRASQEELRQQKIKLEERIRKMREELGDEFVDSIFGEKAGNPQEQSPKTSPEQVAMDKRVVRAIDSAHHSVRGTLSRLNRQVIASVIERVDALRAESPDISTRQIVGHIHHRGQLKEASEHDIEMAKVIHMFAAVEKGQQPRLCI